MIENRQQYRVTKIQIEKLRAALENHQPDPNLHPMLQKAVVDGLKSNVKSLSDELIEYERRQ
jgi:hypothetical protein